MTEITALAKRIARYQTRMGLEPKTVRILDLKHHWASCSTDGTLNFHWKAMMAPSTVLDYIVVHELAHLRYPNHTRAFWRQVDKILPDYQERKEWLRVNGAGVDLCEAFSRGTVTLCVSFSLGTLTSCAALLCAGLSWERERVGLMGCVHERRFWIERGQSWPAGMQLGCSREVATFASRMDGFLPHPSDEVGLMRGWRQVLFPQELL